MQQKSLVVRKIGWQRVVRNLSRFGWELSDAVQHTQTQTKTKYSGTVDSWGTVNITPSTTKKKKVRIHLNFVRYDEDFENLSSVSLLEFFYNLFFIIRSIAGTLLPFTFIMLIPPIGPLIGGLLFGEENWSLFIAVVLGCLLGWAVLMILENVFSRIAGKILKLKSN